MIVYYECASHPHNIYIQWLTEGGLIVFILFILYLILLMFFILNNDGEKKYKIISIAVIIIMFWPIMSTGSLVKNWFGVSTFFIVGLCICLSRFRNNSFRLDLWKYFFNFFAKNKPKKKKNMTDKVVPLPCPNKDPIYIKRKIIVDDNTLK